MEFSSFTLFMTEDCNFNCSYCYQKKGNNYIDISTLEMALDFFLPYLSEECYINFYGGEPLLAFELIRHAVNTIEDKTRNRGKKIQYAITTNGSLIDDDILRFLSQHQFSLLLSFDGIAQDKFRIRGSFRNIVPIIGKLLKSPNIKLETNSVFTPTNVGYLSKSIQSIVELGAQNVDISLSPISSWESSSLIQLKEELESLTSYLVSHYQKTGQIPLHKFRKNSKRGVFACYAGKDGMAMTTDGKLWGCHLFWDYFKGMESRLEYTKYCFGNLASFINNHSRTYPRILANYSGLRMSRFYTSDKTCQLCEHLMECTFCPMHNLLSGSDIRMIPSWACETRRIFRIEKKRFWQELSRRS